MIRRSEVYKIVKLKKNIQKGYTRETRAWGDNTRG